MSIPDSLDTVRPRRSALSVPAINQRALDKTHALDCDVVIFDLEDSVAPDVKDEARDNLRRFFTGTPLKGRETVIRINAADTAFYEDDIAIATLCRPDAILIPKVGDIGTIARASEALDRAGVERSLRIWAMIETPKAILNAASIASIAELPSSRLDCLVVGLNDLRNDTGVRDQPGRPYLIPWLMQVVLAARASGLDVLDSVYNEFRDLDIFARECIQGRDMGFDGKMLIHPAQIDAANRNFGPDESELKEAQAIIAAFAEPSAINANVINMNGKMVERLHMEQAERLVHKAQIIAARKDSTP